jgi:hypothetical protein
VTKSAAYIESKLKEDEKVVYKTRIHPVILGAPFLLMIIFGLSIPNKGTSAIILLLISILFAGLAARSFQNSELALTGTRLLGKLGFPAIKAYDVELAQIADVAISQPALGKILNFGRVMVKCANGTGASFRMIDNPVGLVQEMQQQVNILREQLAKQEAKS